MEAGVLALDARSQRPMPDVGIGFVVVMLVWYLAIGSVAPGIREYG